MYIWKIRSISARGDAQMRKLWIFTDKFNWKSFHFQRTNFRVELIVKFAELFLLILWMKVGVSGLECWRELEFSSNFPSPSLLTSLRFSFLLHHRVADKNPQRNPVWMTTAAKILCVPTRRHVATSDLTGQHDSTVAQTAENFCSIPGQAKPRSCRVNEFSKHRAKRSEIEWRRIINIWTFILCCHKISIKSSSRNNFPSKKFSMTRGE